MLELTWRGANPLKLPNRETRKWLEDGDILAISGWCQGDAYRVGFGEVSGRIVGSNKSVATRSTSSRLLSLHDGFPGLGTRWFSSGFPWALSLPCASLTAPSS